MGGRTYEYDYLSTSNEDTSLQEGSATDTLTLELPSSDSQGPVYMLIPFLEQTIIDHALDCLPWSPLSWSIHRGMRDILAAYSRPRFNKHRRDLANLLKQTVVDKPQLLDAMGWNPSFVRNSMGDMASSAILAGRGNSGDLVRVVVDIVLAVIRNRDLEHLDEVHYWRGTRKGDHHLDDEAIIALTKVFGMPPNGLSLRDIGLVLTSLLFYL